MEAISKKDKEIKRVKDELRMKELACSKYEEMLKK